jgi:hypothetical protein
MAEQHPVGSGQDQRVAGAGFPGQMPGPGQKLRGLDSGELREGAVRRLVAPDPLGRRQHRVAAVAFLVVAVDLAAMGHDLVADTPVADIRSDRPDDAGRVRSGDVERMIVEVQRRHRMAERRPDAVVVDACRHDQDQDLIRPDLGDVDHLLLEGGRRISVALPPQCPGMHPFRDDAGRNILAKVE